MKQKKQKVADNNNQLWTGEIIWRMSK